MKSGVQAVAACLAGLVLATPAAADDRDRYKDAIKRQREYEKQLRKQWKKQQEWAREQQERYEDHARKARKRQREFDRELRERWEDRHRDDRFPGHVEPYPDYLAPQPWGPGAGPYLPPMTGPGTHPFPTPGYWYPAPGAGGGYQVFPRRFPPPYAHPPAYHPHDD